MTPAQIASPPNCAAAQFWWTIPLARNACYSQLHHHIKLRGTLQLRLPSAMFNDRPDRFVSYTRENGCVIDRQRLATHSEHTVCPPRSTGPEVPCRFAVLRDARQRSGVTRPMRGNVREAPRKGLKKSTLCYLLGLSLRGQEVGRNGINLFRKNHVVR